MKLMKKYEMHAAVEGNTYRELAIALISLGSSMLGDRMSNSNCIGGLPFTGGYDFDIIRKTEDTVSIGNHKEGMLATNIPLE